MRLWIALGLLVGIPFHWAMFVLQTAAASSPVWSSPVMIQLFGFLGLLATGIFNIISQRSAATRADKAAERAEQKAEEVKTTVATATKNQEAALSAIKDTGDKVHTLVNSEKGTTLGLYAVAARSLAVVTEDPQHIKAANDAEAALANHIAQQKIVDAGLQE